jgi:hypothetical protein
MALNLGIRLALEAEGFTETEIAQIEAALPTLTKLLADYKAASPDILAIIPVAEMVINRVKGK